MIGILDYGVGNINSIANMLDFLDIPFKFIKDKNDVINVSKIILPGVGSFDYAMEKLKEKNFINLIHSAYNNNLILVGICLGLQLLGNKSEEGHSEGLKLVDFNVKSLKTITSLTVPHMGWSQVEKNNFNYNTNSEDKFYFVHSYYVPVSTDTSKYESILISNYGINFSAGIKKNNIFGFQFHPEKSQKYGMGLFKYIENLKI